MWSPIILVEFLLAPTVPSPPRPQNLHSTVPGADVIGAGLTSGKLKLVTSSTIPIVNLDLGSSFSSSLYTANIDEIAKNDFNLSVNSYIQHEVEKERINIYSLNHNVNSNLIKGIEKQLELNKMIDSLEQTNYHDSLLNMLKAVIKKYSTKNKDMFKRERSLFNIVF